MKSYIVVLITFSLSLLSVNSHAQKRKTIGPIWTYHVQNTDVIGLSLGAFPEINHSPRNTRTYGVRAEVFPLSFLYFMAPVTPLSSSDESYALTMDAPSNQAIYGLNVTTGTFDEIDLYGISASATFAYGRKTNGIAIAGMGMMAERMNGIMISPGSNAANKVNGIMIGGMWGNYAKQFNGIQISVENTVLVQGRGLQIGVFNKAKNFRGIQLGLWNKNEKRSLPFINWQFKS